METRMDAVVYDIFPTNWDIPIPFQIFLFFLFPINIEIGKSCNLFSLSIIFQIFKQVRELFLFDESITGCFVFSYLSVLSFPVAKTTCIFVLCTEHVICMLACFNSLEAMDSVILWFKCKLAKKIVLFLS